MAPDLFVIQNNKLIDLKNKFNTKLRWHLYLFVIIP